MAGEDLSRSAARVQSALDAAGLEARVVELPGSTRTARDAASTVGCEVAQIAKSLVFRATDSGRAVLVIASGVNRVDETRVAALVGEPIERAAPDFVRAQTGFAIGGVPPVGHLNAIETLIDEDLLALEAIWAAAGTPRAVFALPSADLERLTGGRVAAIRAEA